MELLLKLGVGTVRAVVIHVLEGVENSSILRENVRNTSWVNGGFVDGALVHHYAIMSV